MRHSLIMISVFAALIVGSPTASAEVLQLRAQAHSGTAGGAGIGGARQQEAFHAGVAGLSYGATVGVEFLFIDGWVEHNQYVNEDGLAGTWTQFMIGLDTEFDLGVRTEGSRDAQGRLIANDAYSPFYGEVGMAVGYGVGTGQQVMPPLDNSEITDKAFLGQVHVGLGYRVTRALSLGLVVPVQAGYVFKSGNDLPANDTNNQYSSAQGAAYLHLRLSLNLI